jgi:hypothetical protein
MGGMACKVVPHVLCRVELRSRGRELFQRQPRIGLLDRGNGWPLGDRALSPQDDAMAPPLTQQRSQEVRHRGGFESGRLDTAIQAQVLALRRHRESGQRREPLRLILIGDDGGRSPGSPAPAARGDEQEAAFVEDGELRSQPAGFVLSPATWSASPGRSPARRAGWRGPPAPDSSSLRPARPSRCARGDSGPRTLLGLPPRCASRSPARWGSRRPWRLAATALSTVVVVGESTCLDAQALVWGLRRHRRLVPKPATTEIASSPTPAPGGLPGARSGLAAGAPQHGVAVVPRLWGIQRVSCTRRYPRSLLYANFNN